MKYIYISIVTLCCFLTGLSALSYEARATDNFDTAAKQAIIIDYDTGTILFSKNADEKMPTSSMSKTMTIYIVFDALQRGDLSLDTELLVSEKAWRKGGSKMFVPVGKKIKVEDLIRGVVIQSGNDATIVLAEGIAGTEEAFVQAMNKKAQELGMNNTHFTNASGWPDPDHYSTAYDLALVTIAMIKNFPEYYYYYSERDFTYGGILQMNRNPLLGMDVGADGVKTGHTEDGGYGLIGSGIGSDGRRVVMVLNGMKSTKERKEEGVRLMRWSLSTFKNISLFENQPVLGQAEVYLGQRDRVNFIAKAPVSYVVSKVFSDDVKVEVFYKEPLKAPVEKGEEIGVVRIYIPKGEQIEVPLIAAERIDAAGLFVRTIAKARLLTTGIGKFK
jgi:D-alanyl-D-alanine carboxypeptidase (penicillin-binding protein 5/6)